MRKLAAIFLLCLLALLLIAARPRPRPCGTRTQCFNLLFPISTATLTMTIIPMAANVIYQDMTSTPNYSIDWPPLPPPIPPPAYPPPVTAPPAGYP